MLTSLACLFHPLRLRRCRCRLLLFIFLYFYLLFLSILFNPFSVHRRRRKSSATNISTYLSRSHHRRSNRKIIDLLFWLRWSLVIGNEWKGIYLDDWSTRRQGYSCVCKVTQKHQIAWEERNAEERYLHQPWSKKRVARMIRQRWNRTCSPTNGDMTTTVRIRSCVRQRCRPILEHARDTVVSANTRYSAVEVHCRLMMMVMQMTYQVKYSRMERHECTWRAKDSQIRVWRSHLCRIDMS